MEVKSLIITGYGLNCETETKAAFDYCGATSDLIHLNDILKEKNILNSYHILSFIGGFSFGDHLGGGTVFANKVKYGLKEQITEFIKSGKLIIGICNGFQTLIRMGLLPGLKENYFTSQKVALDWNDSGVFRDSWVTLKTNPESPCVFIKDINKIELPIRHGEGKFVAEKDILDELESENLVAFRYADKNGRPTSQFPYNPNGSLNNIAGICDPTGRIFGLMPHPEAYLSPYNHPNWRTAKESGTLRCEGAGTLIFRNAVEYIKEKL
ncbi:MAG: phosphoribosylformylglycinamidine synthase I [Victivallales bacterium]|nr:phosphoribosylformylglycinamidine synthase I [Victivallales bacterium]